MEPSAVCGPVAIAMPVPAPLVTRVPAKAAHGRSAIADERSIGASGSLTTGSDSPVSVDSSTSSTEAPTSRRSAGTRSPAERITTSPATMSRAGMGMIRPPRRTRATGDSIVRRASMARVAFPSSSSPIAAFSATMARIAIPSRRSRSPIPATAAATINSSAIGSAT